MADLATELDRLTAAGIAEAELPGAARDLATALKWSGAEVRHAPGPGRLPLGLVKSSVLGQPAAVFGVMGDAPQARLLDVVATYAYHATIHWGVLAGDGELIVFNSHWLSRGEWYRLPAIRPPQLPASLDLVESLSPEGVVSGQIDQVAQEQLPFEQLLRPVDDALVSRLDYWRDEALRHAEDSESLDERLQTLFSQLFILRAAEDRGLTPHLPSLAELLEVPLQAGEQVLHRVFDAACERIQSELFDERVFPAIPFHVVRGVVRDLYNPVHLPGEQRRYDFSWIDADVLGRAYEKYLASLLVPARLRNSQLRLFDQPLRDVDRISVQKSQGVYYTPSFLVRYITERALSESLGGGDDQALTEEAIPRIADFACGSGSFLTTAADLLIRRLRLGDPDRNWARRLVDGRLLVGVDNDPRAVTLARLSLWLRFAEEPDPLPLPALRAVIVTADSLGESVWEQVPAEYDIVLGNPPFLSTGQIEDRESLSSRFRAASGRFDYSYLFLELAIKRLRPGGILGLVLPNRLSVNRDATRLREILSEECSFRTIADFGSEEVFLGTKAHILVLLAVKGPPESETTPVRVVEIRNLPEHFPGVSLYRADRTEGEIRTASLVAFDTEQPSGGGPWLLLSKAERTGRITLENSGPALSEVAEVVQGIRTGANDIYIVHLVADPGGDVVEIENGLGQRGVVEKRHLRPVVYGSDIQRYSALPRGRHLLYAYTDSGALSSAELQETAPRTWEYFRRNQDLLASRSSLTDTGKEWHELIRPRDLGWLEQPKILTKDLITAPAFTVDLAGDFFLVGGTAVVPSDPAALAPILALTNSRLAGWFLGSSMPAFRTRYRKLEPRHLQRLPIPESLLVDGSVRDELVQLVTERLNIADPAARAAIALDRQIDALLEEASGVPEHVVE